MLEKLRTPEGLKLGITERSRQARVTGAWQSWCGCCLKFPWVLVDSHGWTAVRRTGWLLVHLGRAETTQKTALVLVGCGNDPDC